MSHDQQGDRPTMPDVTTSPRYGQRPAGWHVLKSLIIAATIALAPVFFAVMFLTVTRLLRPSFGWWAWTVPVATEGCFVIAYLLGILLEWAGKPMNWLRAVPWLFAASSLILNVWASLGDVPGMVGHAVVTVAFFLPLIAGEAAVRSLSRTDAEIRDAAALADARQYAIDYCRAAKGPAWRWRIPSLVRRQILRRRLPDEVRSAVLLRAGGMGGWQKDVRDWLRRELQLGAQAGVDARSAVSDITRQALPAPAEPSSAEHVQQPSAPPSQKAPAPTARKAPASAVKAAQRKGRKATDEDIREAIREMYREGGSVKKYRVMKDLPVGDGRADRLLAEVQAERPPLALAK